MPLSDWIAVVLTFLSPVLIAVVAVFVLNGGLRRFAKQPLEKCFEGIELHNETKPGDVMFVYHTYRGIIVWVTQTEHRVIAPPADAERLLDRLLRFNLTWGIWSYGMVFIPFIAMGNYYAQRRSIRQQVEAMHARVN